MISDHSSIVKFMRNIDIEESDLQFKPTIKDCYSTYRRINKDVFKNKLPRVKIFLTRLHQSWGICTSETKHCHITLNQKFFNKQFFLMVLAHEMVHVYQHYFENTINHGISFNKWRPIFAKFCIPLSNGYHNNSIIWHSQRNYTQIYRS